MPRKQSVRKRHRTILKPKLKHPKAHTKMKTTNQSPIKKERYYVYLMTNGVEYKIGITNNPERRLKQCQTGNPKQLSYVCIVERPNKASAIFLEKSIHHGLKQHRLQGEWFKLNHQSLSIVIKELHPLPI